MLLGFTIGTDGTVKAPEVLDSSGFADLDWQALECARNFHYRPATLNGKPVESPWRVELRMGDPTVVSEERRAVGDVARDVRTCVLAAYVVRKEPGDMEWTDLKLTFRSGHVEVTVPFSTGSEALTRKVVECAHTSPALASAATVIHYGSKIMSMNWTNISRFATKP